MLDRNQSRPAGLRKTMTACRAGDTLVAKLDRLARSVLDARDIIEKLTTREVKLSLESIPKLTDLPRFGAGAAPRWGAGKTKPHQHLPWFGSASGVPGPVGPVVRLRSGIRRWPGGQRR